ncbi:MAG: alpha/beta fold hydrolase [Acidobacteriota bacterium]
MPSVGRFHYLEALPPDGLSQARLRGAGSGLLGTLVLIHGFPLSARMWEPQLALAAQGWRVIAPQLRGFDGTPAGSVAASVDDFAGDLVDLLDGLHIDHAVIGGLSMGGYITLALFRHAARYFRGMVLADTRAQADPPEAAAGRQQMLTAVRERGAVAAADEMLPKLVCDATRSHQPAVVDALRAMIVGNSSETVAGALMAIMARPDAMPVLPTIHCPTLIVVGDQDAITPPALSEDLRRGIPGSTLVVIPDAGHMSNMEQPAAFNAALASFLERKV